MHRNFCKSFNTGQYTKFLNLLLFVLVQDFATKYRRTAPFLADILSNVSVAKLLKPDKIDKLDKKVRNSVYCPPPGVNVLTFFKLNVFYDCRYAPVRYDCKQSPIVLIETSTVMIQWSSDEHQDFSLNYVIGEYPTPDNSVLVS